MVASSGKEAHTNSDKVHSYQVGMCQKYTRECWEVGSLYGSAIDAWNGAREKHKGDRNPPEGAPCYYGGGQYGHAVVAQGGGRIRSTDCHSSGDVSDEDLSWPERQWGYSYLGWTGDINGVDCPNLGTPPPPPPEEDDVPNYDHGSQSKDVKIKANEWVLVKWDSVTGDGAMDKGSSGVHIGARTYTASLHATLTAPQGATIRSGVYEYESGDNKPVETNPGVESLATSGDTAIEYNHAGYCSKGRGLIFRITCTSDATLRSADVVVLSWK